MCDVFYSSAIKLMSLLLFAQQGYENKHLLKPSVVKEITSDCVQAVKKHDPMLKKN